MPPDEGAGDRRTGPVARPFALLGDPVAHSLSPRIHNAALAAELLDGVYSARRCSHDELPALMRSLASAGGGGNVTVPHKPHAAACVEQATEAVQRTAACNTFWRERGRLVGDNTDVPGFDRALRSFFGDPHGARVLVLGAGGAAAAAVLALVEARVDRVALVNRTVARADALVDRLRANERGRVRVEASLDRLAGVHFDLAVNATSLGLEPADPLPAPLDSSPEYAAVFDLVYGLGPTAWVRAARDAGLPAADGAEMLLQQAAVAFERWWQRPAPLDAMRTALEQARADDDAPSDHSSAPTSKPVS